MNKELIRQVIKYMRKEPFDVEMARWLASDPYQISSCGTTGCVAGIACFLAHEPKCEKMADYHKLPTEDYAALGAKLLGLANAREVFYESRWPEPFCSQMSEAREKFNRTRTCPGHAKARKAMTMITIARLEHLLEHGE